MYRDMFRKELEIFSTNPVKAITLALPGFCDALPLLKHQPPKTDELIEFIISKYDNTMLLMPFDENKNWYRVVNEVDSFLKKDGYSNNQDLLASFIYDVYYIFEFFKGG